MLQPIDSACAPSGHRRRYAVSYIMIHLRELRKDRSLRALGVDASAPGRPAITGKAADAVWDFVQLKGGRRNTTHTAHPHLTLDIHQDYLWVQIAIPNGVPAPMRRRLAGLGHEGMTALNRAILRNAKRLLPPGATIEVHVVQRHHTSQRSTPKIDARLSFRLETGQRGGAGRVREQREWVETFIALLERKRSNIHFGYVARLPWGSRGLETKESIGLIAGLWVAMGPLLDALRPPTDPRRRPRA